MVLSKSYKVKTMIHAVTSNFLCKDGIACHEEMVNCVSFHMLPLMAFDKM